MSNTSILFFYGGAQSVTGANFLLECRGTGEKPLRILIDCGMEQGTDVADQHNKEAFAYDPATVDVLIVTHAHLDHVGRIPKLVHDGFDGIIYSTPATLELAELILEDSSHIIEEEARQVGTSPLYSADDVRASFRLWKTAPYYASIPLRDGVTFSLKDAGHILGSAMVEIVRAGKKIVFTGDLGNSPAPLLRDTDTVTDADYLVMESVYGDRNHEPPEERARLFKHAVEEAIKRRGVLLIPSFSIDRTQVILHELNNLIEHNELPSVPVFLDSPLAIKVTDVYRHHAQNFNPDTKKETTHDDIFDFPKLTLTMTREESKDIIDTPPPKIIIAGSGMSHGGRIIYHERVYLDDPSTTLLFVGYQAPGTPGREIQEGAQRISLFGREVRVRAHIMSIDGYSAHKDSEHLLAFVEHAAPSLKKVFVVMGEPHSSLFLVQRIRDFLGLVASAPTRGEQVSLEL